VLALRRAPGARSLSAVFYGQVMASVITEWRRRSAAAVVIGLASLQLACPHDAPLEPAGDVLRVRSALVGPWMCSTEEEPDWATLSVGRQSASVYQLTLRPTKPPAEGADELPWIAFARPRRVGGREIWSVWMDRPRDPTQKYSFLRLERAQSDVLILTSLGNGMGLPSRLNGESQRGIARILTDPKETIAEGSVTCRRTSG